MDLVTSGEIMLQHRIWTLIRSLICSYNAFKQQGAYFDIHGFELSFDMCARRQRIYTLMNIEVL